MIIKEEFLSRLRKIFGLNLYEVKVWTALLSRSVSTAGDLSSISDVPRSRTYDILESLEKKGFIVTKLGKPIKFMALKPEEVIERVKKNLRSETEEKAKRLERVKGDDVLKELKNLYNQDSKYVDPSDMSGSMRGRQNIYNHLDMMVREAEKSITIVTTPQGLNRKMEALRPSLKKAKDRGVDIRIGTSINDENKDIAKELSEVAEIRDMSDHSLKARFTIVDSRGLLFWLLNDENIHPDYDVSVWLNAPFFAQALEEMFEKAWEDFKPLKESKK